MRYQFIDKCARSPKIAPFQGFSQHQDKAFFASKQRQMYSANSHASFSKPNWFFGVVDSRRMNVHAFSRRNACSRMRVASPLSLRSRLLYSVSEILRQKARHCFRISTNARIGRKSCRFHLGDMSPTCAAGVTGYLMLVDFHQMPLQAGL